MKFSWFPGHMKKALRELKERIPLADLIIFMIDARIPASSFNPELEKTAANKKILYVINKTDLASPSVTSAWLKYFRERNMNAVAVSSKNMKNSKVILDRIDIIRKEIQAQRALKNRIDGNVRAIALGIPNSGKSTIINRLAGKTVAAAGKKAGLTRALQWLSAGKDLEILDVPGIFYPRLSTEEMAWHLAAVGAAREVAFPVDELSFEILKFLKKRSHPFTEGMNDESIVDSLDFAGRKNNFIISGGKVDYERTSMWIVSNFREGKFGAYSLEFPPREKEGEAE